MHCVDGHIIIQIAGSDPIAFTNAVLMFLSPKSPSSSYP